MRSPENVPSNSPWDDVPWCEPVRRPPLNCSIREWRDVPRTKSTSMSHCPVRLAAREICAGAEVATGAGDHNDAYVCVVARIGQYVGHLAQRVGSHRVVPIGSVDRDECHPVVTFDKKSTPQQRDAIGGVLNTVFPVKWGKFSTREDTIEWHDDAQMSHAKMGSGMAEISLQKGATLRPDKSAPTVVKNLQYWFSNSNEGFVLSPSTHHFDGDVKFSEKNKNGFNIVWTAKGDVKAPAAAKAAMP